MFGLHIYDVLTLGVYLIGITIIGLAASRGVKGTLDYFMGGRKFGKAVLIMHAFGTGTHTDAAVNVVGASYKMGMRGIWYAWLPLFCTPFYWVMMPLFRRMRYITTGVLLTIIVSLYTPEQPKALLDKFYTTMHTPVGQEDKLKALGYEVRD